MPVGIPRDGLPERRTALPSPLQSCGAIGVGGFTTRLLAMLNASLVSGEIGYRSACGTRGRSDVTHQGGSMGVPPMRIVARGRKHPPLRLT